MITTADVQDSSQPQKSVESVSIVPESGEFVQEAMVERIVRIGSGGWEL
jgi:hypothetical protein